MQAPVEEVEFREIKLWLDSLERPRTPLIQIQLQAVTGLRTGFPVLPARYLRAPITPDELVIQQRGRKRLPVTWSPDLNLKRISSCHSKTPPKDSPIKIRATQQSASRKRLFPLTPGKTDFNDISTPVKFKITSPFKSNPVKRPKIYRNLIDEL